MTVTPRVTAAVALRAELADLAARVAGMERAASTNGDLERAIERIAARCELLVEVSDAVYVELVDRLDRLEAALADVRHASASTGPIVEAEPTTSGRSHSYEETVQRVRALVTQLTPAGATVAVVGKGDPALTDLDGRIGWHFPRQADGRYLGYYPRNDAEAVAMLEEARLAGAEFLVFPSTSLWWLEFYRGFAEHLHAHHAAVVRDTLTCAIYRLIDRRPPVDGPAAAAPATAGPSDTKSITS